MALSQELQDKLRALIASDRVVLFMKGTPQMPQCGFSAAVVDILGKLDVPFKGVDVLADHEVREGIKLYANWPTLPQLYIDQEFVGGCDIVRELYASGDLQKKLGAG